MIKPFNNSQSEGKLKFLIMKKIMFFLLMLTFSLKGNAQVFVKIRPIRPAVVVVKPACPGPNHIWVDGDWRWNPKRNEYVWVDGYWLAPKPGRNWIAGEWIEGPEGHKWVPGHWVKVERIHHPRGVRRRR
jgi:hypothetical protein